MTHENMRSSPSSGETGNRPELLGYGDVGLQARLLIGDLTSPRLILSKQKLQPIAERGANGITHQTADMYQKASMIQRRRHQRETGLTLSQWRDGVDSYLDKIRQDTAHSARKEFLKKIKVTNAQDFYDKYLGRESDVVKFVDDIERVATREQIEGNQDIIKNLGNAFGYESSEVIDHLIHGVRNVKTDINAFINQGRKTVNTPAVLENKLLQKIREDSTAIKESDAEPGVRRKTKPSKKVSPEKAEPARAAPRYRSTPITRIDLDAEPEPRPSGRKEARPSRRKEQPKKKTVEPIKVFPAPVQQERRDEEHLMTDAELATARLLSDGDRIDHEQEVTILRESEIKNHYIRELHAMIDEYGRDFVLERAEVAVQRLQGLLQKLGLKGDKRSKEQSWYLKGIAKARFLANTTVDVQQIVPTVEAYDPLLHYQIGRNSSEGQKSIRAEEDIINDMLGWEVYRQRKKSLNILAHLDPLIPSRDKRKFQELLAKAPNDDSGTLSSSQLREIGRLVRKYIPRR